MIVAGIVTYNPEIKRLTENIHAIVRQVSRVIIYDNNSTNSEKIRELASDYNLEVIYSDRNNGLGVALNAIFSIAEKMGAEWVITLDQDSICMGDYIIKASDYMNKEEVGIIVPKIIDHNLRSVETSDMEYVTTLKRCITSAAIVNINAYHKVNGYDETLFVDYVDFDFSSKIYLSGYKILKIHNSVLNHELGKSTNKKILFWQFRYTEHDAEREYYIARNILIYVRRYWRKLNIIRDILSLCKHYVLIIIYDRKKIEKLKKLSKGVLDGIKYKGVRCE